VNNLRVIFVLATTASRKVMTDSYWVEAVTPTLRRDVGLLQHVATDVN